MFRIKNLFENDDVVIADKKGIFQVLEYKRDLSVHPGNVVQQYYAAEMNVRRRILVCEVGATSVVTQAGAMQWFAGNVSATTGVKGVGDFIGKLAKGAVSGEAAVKPEYTGNGLLVLEPTYKHLLLLDAADWPGGVALEDGLFLACEGTVDQKIIARTNISSAIAGGQGLFNLALSGQGAICIESGCPWEELVTIELDRDVVKIDGNLAIAWSAGLNFSVERSGKSLVGSMASGEGLVNVFRGTGKILMMPTKEG